MKSGKLSPVELHYINTNPAMTAEEIAGVLDRSVAIVKKNRKQDDVYIAPQGNINKDYMDQVVPKDKDGKSRGVAFATSSSTERADEFKKTSGTYRYQDGIGKVFND